ncbi:MAG TPA: single-stranded DNA-binding protein [Thermoflexia bacterium]|nr:single-stranded DNA-binding protein [Thermoflexia bacterium]
MASYQKIVIVGNLGGDPEMRYTPDGTPVTNFSVATNRKWNNSDGSAGEETTWFRVTVWRRQAETVAQYLKKGSQVLVEGRMKADRATGGPRVWSGQDGVARASYEITANRVVFLGGRANATGAGGGAAASGGADFPEDEIPF